MPYKNKEDQAAWFQRNKQAVYEKRKAYYDVWDSSGYQKAYREQHKAKLAEYIAAWQKKNPDKLKAIKAKRRAAKLCRVPPWQTESERKSIADFYQNCPVGYEVDHVVPLQDREVSGLHILNNLQYLTVAQNRSKGNKL
jgi:5-methylcytosine-specific restriction endonuclease McrA